jgi:hypothetical protein
VQEQGPNGPGLKRSGTPSQKTLSMSRKSNVNGVLSLLTLALALALCAEDYCSSGGSKSRVVTRTSLGVMTVGFAAIKV